MKLTTIFLATFLATTAFLATFAYAAEPPTLDEIVAECRRRFPATAAVAQCVTDFRFSLGEWRDEDILASLDAGRERDEAILVRLDGTDSRLEVLDGKLDKLAREARSVPPQAAPQRSELVADQVASAAPLASVASVGYVQTPGVGWLPVAQPTLMSVYSITGFEPDTLHISNLRDDKSRENCGGAGGADLLVVTNHGVPVSDIFVPAGAPWGFVQAYYDENGDGEPDEGTVWALDLTRQEDIWVTWRTGDDLQFRYLRRSRQIAVDGLGYQTVYRPTTRADADIVACARDVTARPGGHPAIPAYRLAQVSH